MHVEIKEPQLKELISAAFMEMLTPENREKILREAIENLLRSSTNNPYDRRSELQRAFDMATYRVVEDMARDFIEKDESVKGKIRELMLAGIERAFTGEKREKLIENVASSLQQNLWK